MSDLRDVQLSDTVQSLFEEIAAKGIPLSMQTIEFVRKDGTGEPYPFMIVVAHGKVTEMVETAIHAVGEVLEGTGMVKSVNEVRETALSENEPQKGF